MNNKFLIASALCMSVSATMNAQNPIVQTQLTADPAPLVVGDLLYVYTGHDEDKADFFWMNEWRVYSTKDMVNWTDHGSPLDLSSFSWADDRAWAAQTIERMAMMQLPRNRCLPSRLWSATSTMFPCTSIILVS